MHRQRRRGTALTIVVALAAAVCAACTGGGGAARARVASPDARLTDAEWDHGASIRRDTDGVVFQPDVVIPGGGAASVVSVSGDGLTWTLDGDADEVDQLAPGKLLLVTNRGAGRVLGVERVGDDVAVTIGPAELTDFFVELEASYEGAIDPALIQVRAAPGLPAAADVTNRDGDGSASGLAGEGPATATTAAATTTTVPAGGPAAPRSLLRPRQVPPVVTTPPGGPGAAPGARPEDRGVLPPVSPAPFPVVPVTGMRAFPLHGSDGSWGVELAYDHNGLKVVGSARVYLEQPRIDFNLVIRDGRIVTAEVSLSGVAGVRASFEAATETGLQANIHQVVDLPDDLSVPVFGPELPFAVNFHQSFKIDTVFSAKKSTLSFTGDYAFQGALRAGYRDGSFAVGAPSGLSVRRSLLQSTAGVSLGVNGFIIAHKLRVTVGIGGFGFAVGPYVSLTTTMSVVNGSDLGIVKCKGATLNLHMGYGIGYVMPAAVANLINMFLRALNLGQIASSGGTKPITTHLATLQGYAPKVKVCAGAV
ncbi:MAG: hypothetical protein R2755_28765 [Acidimicrobiales bacterium]